MNEKQGGYEPTDEERKRMVTSEVYTELQKAREDTYKMQAEAADIRASIWKARGNVNRPTPDQQKDQEGQVE